MISYLKIFNFRAFREQPFKFTKLNIFVGANNSGKSSALSALNILAQTSNASLIYGSPLILNGPFDQLGTYKDMVHGGRASTKVRFDLKLSNYDVSLDFKYRSQRREVELAGFNLFQDQKPLYEFSQTSQRFDLKLGGKNVEAISPDLKKRRPRFTGALPYPFPLAYSREYGGSDSTISDDAMKSLRDADRATYQFTRRFRDFFAGYESLSPFRVQPERTYLYSGETADKVGRNGQNAVTLLANDSSKRGSERIGFVDIISEWLKRTNISGGLKVKHLTERHFEIAVSGRDGSDHNICDVGFGVSQVLPVLVSGINFATRKERMRSALVVQEPEIHLHPNAQAELGSFFVEIAKKSGQVFLETHSDTLVIRVARHIAQGDIAPEDVTMFFVEDSPSGRVVTPVNVEADGTLFSEWPGDFFPQRQAESFALAKASIAGDEQRVYNQLDLFSRVK